jgi:hypothetical protein
MVDFHPEELPPKEEPLGDHLPPPEETEPTTPSKENRHTEACFPSNDYGMPLALLSIPPRELPFFWADGKYRKFEIVYVKVQAKEHEYLFKQKTDRTFYVHDKEGNIGLVPFPNSTVVWPWEMGWLQDLAPENKGKVRADLRPSEKKR